MMRLLLIVLILSLTAGCTFLGSLSPPKMPVEVKGILSGKTVLRGQVSMTGDVLIPVGSQLIIRPGTTVIVRNSESTKIDPEYLSAQTELLVRGSLVIDGESDAVVTFIPEKAVTAGEVAWAGIILDEATETLIQHTTLLQPDTGILIVNSSPVITNNKISKARYGIVVQGGSAKILGNEISLGEGGIFCWNQATPYLKDNYVIANDEEGIVVDRSSKPYLDRNTVSGNSIGLVVPADLPYDPTMIAGNKVNIRILASRQEGQL